MPVDQGEELGGFGETVLDGRAHMLVQRDQPRRARPDRLTRVPPNKESYRR